MVKDADSSNEIVMDSFWGTARKMYKSAWAEVLQMLSTSTVSVVVFSIVIPIVVSCGIAAIEARHLFLQNQAQHKAGQSVASLFIHAVFDWPTLFAICVTALAWVVLFGVGIIRAERKADVERQGEIEKSAQTMAQREKDFEKVVAEKDSRIQLVIGEKNADIERLEQLIKPPDLEIRWNPGEFPYFYPYMHPPGKFNLQYRLCIVNNTDHRFTNVRVTLDKLMPRVLNCVPCSLKLMHDNTEPYPTSFDLPPRGHKFVDLMLQGLESRIFWIFHTVTRVRNWEVPAQAYSMTITAEADDYAPKSRDFTLVENGPLWNLRPIN